MNDFLMYLLNSSICLSALYLLFRALMRKETYFKLNRIVLLSIVLCSLIIPKLIMPQIIQQAIQQPIEVELPVFKVENNQLQEIPETGKTSIKVETTRTSYVPEKITQSHFSIQAIFVCLYITGLLITFLILVYGLTLIFILSRKAKVFRMDGYRLLIVEKEIAAFSFGKLVFISQRDYEEHQQLILAHEKEHIRFGHFYDLIFLEAIKIIYWFNPFIYMLIRDIKEIHEFQADNHTLTTGIDATKYQLLIIQKSVGPQKFALANSFNHCQIRNRIVMMNKLKTSKAWRWKVATFLPLLALLLMAFGKPGEKKDSPQIASFGDFASKPEHNHFQILVDAKGKVLINISGLDNRQQLLSKMGEAYHIVFRPKELEEFNRINSFGVPMNVMKAFLGMRPEEKDNPQNKLGIPCNSPGNEFKAWVATARAVAGKEMKITIKGDQSAPYSLIKKIIVTLKDLNEDRYNLISEQPRLLEQPKVVEQTKLIKPSGEQLKVRASRAVTVILDKGNTIYYYEGTRVNGIDPVVIKTDSLGIRKYLLKKNFDVMIKVSELRMKKADKKLSDEDFQKQRKEIMSDKAGPIVIIKSTDAATYGNLIAIMDEMELCNIGRYDIVNIADYDINLIKKARIDLNPPAFSLQKPN